MHSCSKEESNFVETDLFVRIDSTKNINEVFNFINSYEHEVEYIMMQAFTSSLPADSLTNALNYLNARPYIDQNIWPVYGFPYEENFKILPRLFEMDNRIFQKDWKDTMQKLKLTEFYDENSLNGRVIFFHVPAGKEKYWAKKFNELDFVVWTELNYIDD